MSRCFVLCCGTPPGAMPPDAPLAMERRRLQHVPGTHTAGYAQPPGICAGDMCALILDPQGNVHAWGTPKGDDESATKSAVPLSMPNRDKSDAVAAACGSAHALVACADASCAAWGSNELGQLATNDADRKAISLAPGEARWSFTDAGTPIMLRHAFRAGLRVVQVACGESHTLLRTEHGQLFSAGESQRGALGYEAHGAIPYARPVEAMWPLPVACIAAGTAHSLAVTCGGALWSWGWNKKGALGAGPSGPDAPAAQAKPRRVALLGVAGAAAGRDFSAAVTVDGALYTWGVSRDGQLGIGEDATAVRGFAASPQRVRAVESQHVVSVACGARHAVCVCSDGTAFAWGAGGEYGSLGTPPASANGDDVECNERWDGVRWEPREMAMPCAGATAVSCAAGDDLSIVVSCMPDEGSSVTVPPRRMIAPPGAKPGGPGEPVPGTHLGEWTIRRLKRLANAEDGGGALLNSKKMIAAEVQRALSNSPSLCGSFVRNVYAVDADADWGAEQHDTAAAAAERAGDKRCAAALAAGDSLEGAGWCALDPTAIEAFYQAALPLLASVRGAGVSHPVAAAAQVALRQLYVWIRNRRGRMLEAEALRPLPILLHNPLLAERTPAARQLLKDASDVLRLLSPVAKRTLSCWWAAYPPDLLASRLVRPLVRCVEVVVSDAAAHARHTHAMSVARWQERIAAAVSSGDESAVAAASESAPLPFAGASPEDVDAHGGLDVCLAAAEALELLHAANGRHREEIIPASQFYCGNVGLGVVDLMRDFMRLATPRATAAQLPGFCFASHPFLMPPSAKRELCQVYASHRAATAYAQAMSGGVGGGVSMESEGAFLSLRIRRDRMLADASAVLLHTLHNNPQELGRPMRVSFVGEEGVDEGGLTRELLVGLSALLLAPESSDAGRRVALWTFLDEPRCLWFRASNGVSDAAPSGMDDVDDDDSNDSDSMDGALRAAYVRARALTPDGSWPPAPSSALWHELVGVLIGLAFNSRQLVGNRCRLPLAFWRQLLGHSVHSREDMAELDPSLSRSLDALMQHEGDVERDIAMEFALPPGKLTGSTPPSLLPTASSVIMVTNENRETFVNHVRRHVLVTSIMSRIESVRRGFHACVGLDQKGGLHPLSMLTPSELELVVCGVPHLDFHALEKNARVVGFEPLNSGAPTVRWLWKWVHASTTPLEAKRALLAFVTGCDRAPLGGLGSVPLVIQRNGDGSETGALPSAHTCFDTLLLPSYSSEDMLVQRLQLALDYTRKGGFGLA
ncbi:HECT domain-containing protein [Pseudoscourfieldia marina]